jgi:hypothetical protein
MKNRIKENINNFEQLEKIYRADKKEFEKTFLEIFPEISNYEIAKFWKTRFDYNNQKEKPSTIKKSDIFFLILTSVITGILIKLPQLFNLGISEELFYAKNAGLIVFFGLSYYLFLSRDYIKTKAFLFYIFVFIVSAIYVNLLPQSMLRDSVNLAYIHLPLMLWCLYGIVFMDFDLMNKTKRINYIVYNGDLAILSAIILISGGILTAVTHGLFSAIAIQINKFYVDYIVVSGLVSVPIVTTFIISNFPSITNKIAPIIAKIFSPIVLITLVVYLISILVTGKDPYNDRDFLIVFNLMLLGVMAIIIFSISENYENKKQRFNEIILLALSTITLLINLVALSAIIYRLGEFGFTPNRTAVFGANLLIFGNLILITIDLFKVNFKKSDIKSVETTISKYLPIYMVWTVFVVFILPFIFRLK